MIDAMHDPGTAVGAARARAAAPGPDGLAPLRAPGGGRVLAGVASWTDPTMTAPGVFYPDDARSPEARLRFYASRFPVVEVDATYYAIPARSTAEHWVERTPPGFTFDVKAHALMTGQPSEVSRLPAELRTALPGHLQQRTRIYANDLPDVLRDEVWTAFLSALEPLRDSGRLGALLLQYPKWVGPSRTNAAMIEEARQRLHGWRAAVEFRNRDWFDDRTRQRTLDLLRRNELSAVIVDAPPGFESSVPAVPAVTSRGLAVIRFHGRNVDPWEAKVARASERFRYLYDERELGEWLPAIRSVSDEAEEVHLIFNNCYGNYGTTNAVELGAMLRRAGYLAA